MKTRNRSLQCISGGFGMRGFTMVELMIAMLLGLIVIAGVSSVFLANLRSYHTNTALGNVQSNARIAFELMARDIRQAGLTGCNSQSPRIANVLNGGPYKNNDKWWANWNNAVHGYDAGSADPAVAIGTGTGERVSGTDSIELLGARGAGLTVVTHDKNAANFTVNKTSNDIANGDIVIVCNPDHAAILQAHKAPITNTTLEYNTGTGTPGNCSKGLGFPTDCSSTNGRVYEFPKNSRIFVLGAYDWYIGKSPAKEGVRSLYRMAFDPTGANGTKATEMVRYVTDMQITYHVKAKNSFEDAAAVGSSWGDVDAVRVTLTLQSAKDNVTTDGFGHKLTRDFTFTTAIRNRN